MSQFKVGDRVRLRTDIETKIPVSEGLEVGSVYTIRSIKASVPQQDGQIVDVGVGGGATGGWWDWRFELVTPAPKPSPVNPDEWDEWREVGAALGNAYAPNNALVFLAILGLLRHYPVRWGATESDTVTLTVKRSTAEFYSRIEHIGVPVADVAAASRKALGMEVPNDQS